jgi:muconolactone D-isomerase
MEFLVHVDASRAYALPAVERDDVIKRERERGRALMSEGVIRHFWRLVGQHGNIGIWAAEDADELEAALTSLPVWPYADIEVTPLATHPMTAQVS